MMWDSTGDTHLYIKRDGLMSTKKWCWDIVEWLFFLLLCLPAPQLRRREKKRWDFSRKKKKKNGDAVNIGTMIEESPLVLVLVVMPAALLLANLYVVRSLMCVFVCVCLDGGLAKSTRLLQIKHERRRIRKFCWKTLRQFTSYCRYFLHKKEKHGIVEPSIYKILKRCESNEFGSAT